MRMLDESFIILSIEALKKIENEVVEIPCIIGGKELKTGNIFEVRMPHYHKHVIARVHLAGKEELKLAIEASLKAKKSGNHLNGLNEQKFS